MMDKNQVKKALLSDYVSKYDQLKLYLDDLNESLKSESKSSVGDKHEVGRAKIQTEIARLQEQVGRVEKQVHLIEQLTDKKIESVAVGALLKTDKAIIYLALDHGVFKYDGKQILVTSLNSPLGKQLKEKKVGDKVKIGAQNHELREIR